MSKIRKQSIDDIGLVLKPCPFCGSNATKGKTEDDYFFVACTKCILYLQCEPWDQKGLIEIWNNNAL